MILCLVCTNGSMPSLPNRLSRRTIRLEKCGLFIPMKTDKGNTALSANGQSLKVRHFCTLTIPRFYGLRINNPTNTFSNTRTHLAIGDGIQCYRYILYNCPHPHTRITYKSPCMRLILGALKYNISFQIG